MPAKPKVIAVVGATASGKSSLATKIAIHYNGEVISADSRQIYRGLDIGTGKITKAEMMDIPHHLIDIKDPQEVYSAELFCRDATVALRSCLQRGHLPIIAGGTFFYVDTLRGTQTAPPVPANPELRNTLETKTTTELFANLERRDPVRAKSIDPNNRRRLIRALEIVEAIGSVPPPTITTSPYKWLIIGLRVEKEMLLTQYKKRITTWLEAGFQAEVENLLAQEVTRSRLQELGFEYTLMLAYIDQIITHDELVERFIQKNWQYAKRQLTWLKRDKEIEWFAPENREAIFRRITTFLTD